MNKLLIGFLRLLRKPTRGVSALEYALAAAVVVVVAGSAINGLKTDLQTEFGEIRMTFRP